jgi:hypothetical protein
VRSPTTTGSPYTFFTDALAETRSAMPCNSSWTFMLLVEHGARGGVGRPLCPNRRVSRLFSDAATLFERTCPQSCSERALTAGYWFQVVQSQKDFQSGALAGVVAELGNPTKNMTRDLRPLLTGAPRLMIQVGKGNGNTSHRYRLTTEGVRAVESKLPNDVAFPAVHARTK